MVTATIGQIRQLGPAGVAVGQDRGVRVRPGHGGQELLLGDWRRGITRCRGEAAGYRPQLTDKQQCCGLTWISTGQLTAAKKILGCTVDALSGSAAAGIPIVGMEPSCTGVLRSDAAELLGRSAEPAPAPWRARPRG